MLNVAFGFVVPLVVFCLIYIFIPTKRAAWPPMVAALVIAAVSMATLISLVFSAPYWQEGTRVVWTGLSVSQDTPLSVGGSDDDFVAKWPNGSLAPALTVSMKEGTTASLSIKGGAGFVYDETSHAYFNGTPISPGDSKTFGDYTVRVSKVGPWGWRQRVEVVDSGGEALAKFTLRRWWPGKPRVRSMRHLIEGNASKPLYELSKVAELDKLLDWAAGVRLLVSGDGTVRLLDEAGEAQVDCLLPAKLTVHWTNLTLPVRIRHLAGQLALDFDPPWQLSCPIPPHEGDEAIELTASRQVLPGSFVFQLPLGPGVDDPRKALRISPQSPYKFLDGHDNEAGAARPGSNNVIGVRDRQVGLSQIDVATGPYSFTLATVRDLPSKFGVIFLAGIAFLCFAAGLYLASPRMPGVNRWVLFGLMACVWNFLSFRLLLAFRYVLDPNALDSLSMGGLTRSFVALSVVPGLLLLLARLRCDWHERPTQRKDARKALVAAYAYLALLALTFIVVFYKVPGIWAGLPDGLASSASWAYGLVLSAVLFYLIVYIRFLYFPDRSGRAENAVTRPWSLVEQFFQVFRRNYEKRIKRIQSKRRPGWLSYVKRVAYFLVGGLLIFGALPFFISLGISQVTTDKSFQEVLIPTFLYWLPALFWLALKVCWTNGQDIRISWRMVIDLLIYAFAGILIPALLVPVAIRDVGSLLAILAIFIPLALMLMVGPWRSKLVGGAVAAALVAMFLAAGILYENVDQIPGGSIFSTAKVRLLNFREGENIQSYLLWANSAKGADSDELPFQELLNGYQHTWENKAIAHEGGPTGLGFGNAPARHSHIRQDTLQFDSAYSFYIVSEYGLGGGLLMLLLYAIPLLLVLMGGARRFDAGYGLASLVMSAFLLEAIFHAGMNLGAFPMTGRSLPLITVNSLSDLVRWTIFFAYAIHALFWRYRGNGEIKDEAASLVTPPASALAKGSGSAQVYVSASAAAGRESPRRYAAVAALVLATPCVMAGMVGWQGYKVMAETKEYSEFSFGPMLEYVGELIDAGVVTLNPDTLTLDVKHETLRKHSDYQLIEQQVARFNALDKGEKIEEVKLDVLHFLEQKLAGVATVEAYQKVLDELRKKGEFRKRPRTVTLFRLQPVNRSEDDEGEENAVEYAAVPNPDFNVRFSFKRPATAQDVPSLALYPEQKDKSPLLVGAAWVMGRWVTAIDPEAPVPWAGYLPRILEDERKRLGPQEAQKRYGALTLNKDLHEAAMRFTAVKGKELHQELLNVRRNGEFVKKLPPRVALSILSLPDGKVLALGGWPRMTSSPFWQQDADFAGWVPSLDWVESSAPKSMKSRYGGDRNFDRALLMGSSTKPLWATIALQIHPRLDEQLRVRGTGTEESEVFGIKINPGWDLHGSPEEWVDFKNYLAYSDNRYQVRLGFLALADKAGGDVIGIAGSPSESESMTPSAPQPWKQYPKFDSKLKFSNHNSQTLWGLDDTPMAQCLRRMYAIGTSRQDFKGRVSFWTKDEQDDLVNDSRPAEQQPSPLFRYISPEGVNFRFDEFSSRLERSKGPRDFITILLGGGTNLWANVNFASAFATCVTGTPVLAHVVANDNRVLFTDRLSFPEVAAKVQPGLKAVLTEGTAFKTLSSSPRGKAALAFLQELPDVEVYAKTGTLKAIEGGRNTSRLVLALVKWKDKARGVVETGMVFSMVGEQAQVGKATEWLGEFLVENQDSILSLLKPAEPAQRK